MPLTPADVHNVAFNKPPIGKRGYNEDEVDQFLDLVEDALVQFQEENEDLKQQVEELEAQVAGGTSSAASSSTAGAATAAASKSVDEAALRKEIEEKLRSEYASKLDDASKAAQKAQNDAKSAQDQLQRAQADAKAARDEAEKAKAEAKSAASSSTTKAAAVGAVGAGTGEIGRAHV